tara:strand:+ start:665 stop:961 length:297 start_codon:yes stop_codon:yes gene_type:complete
MIGLLVACRPQYNARIDEAVVPVDQHCDTCIGRIVPWAKFEKVTASLLAVVTLRLPPTPIYKALVMFNTVLSLSVTAMAEKAETVASAVRYATAILAP